MHPALSPHECAVLLRNGAVIAYPTEGVWGLGCDPRNEAAVLRLLQIKQRPIDKGLILIASDLDQLRPWLHLAALPPSRLTEVFLSWPGPFTWVMPASADAPYWITGAHDSIAVRISKHPTVTALCDAFGGALVSTSANISGQPAAKRVEELAPELLQQIDGVAEGQTDPLQGPSRIRDAMSGEVIRG